MRHRNGPGFVAAVAQLVEPSVVVRVVVGSNPIRRPIFLSDIHSFINRSTDRP
jgi:hypothetical protein